MVEEHLSPRLVDLRWSPTSTITVGFSIPTRAAMPLPLFAQPNPAFSRHCNLQANSLGEFTATAGSAGSLLTANSPIAERCLPSWDDCLASARL